MKDYIQMLIITAIVLLVIPLIGYAAGKNRAPSFGGAKSASAEAAQTDTVKILFTGTGEVREISAKDYAIGAVFAQMPADFDEEALKAQAILAYTYAERRRRAEERSPSAELRGAYISDDTSRYQAFFTEDQAKALYGDGYAEAYKRISAAAESAEGQMICYDGEPIITAFHGISFGHTESASAMWGEDIPYLVSAESLSDAELDVCRRTYAFTDSEIADRLPVFEGADLSLLAPAEKSSLGTVLSLSAGDAFIDAETFSQKLSLPSCHMELERIESDNGDGWKITTMGCGHLVGMSQYGADSLAADGKTAEQILLHYFKGCTLIKNS